MPAATASPAPVRAPLVTPPLVARTLGLVRTGAWAAFGGVAMIVVQVVVYAVWPPPPSHDAAGYLALLADEPLHGLLSLDLLYVVSNLLAFVVYLALAVALWEVSRSGVVLALGAGVLGMAAYLASFRPLELLTLAHAWEFARGAERVAIEATAQGMVATWQGSAFTAYYLLNLVALLVLAVLMVRSDVFGRATAVWGIVAAALMVVPSNAGTVGLVLAFASLLPWAVFSVLVGRRLLGMAGSWPAAVSAPPAARSGSGGRRSPGRRSP